MKAGPEEILQRSIVKVWRAIGRPDVQMQADATGMIGLKRRPFAAAMGTRSGWPDLAFVGPDGGIAFMELKSVKGRLTAEQKDFQAWCKKHRIPHEVVRTLDEAIVFWRVHGLSKEALQVAA